MTKEEQIKFIEENYPYVCGRLSTRRVRNTFFDEIKTEIQAYLLGFHCADGCVDPTHNTFRVQVQERDSELIYYFKDFIAPDSRLFTHEPREYFDKKQQKSYIKGKMFGIDVYCARLNKGLEKWGFGQNKTYHELHIPEMDELLIPHFLRGYFDGDGSVVGYLRKPSDKKHPNYSVRTYVSFTSKTRTLLDEIGDYLENIGITHFNICKCSRECYILSIAKSELKKIFDLFYTDANFYLKRKYEKFNHLVNTEESQLIAEFRNAQELKASDTNNTPTSAEHPIGMNICADLTGNCENSEIKSSEDNNMRMERNDSRECCQAIHDE